LRTDHVKLESPSILTKKIFARPVQFMCCEQTLNYRHKTLCWAAEC